MPESKRTAAKTPAPGGTPWLVSPGFDLAVVANLWWLPLLPLGWAAIDGGEHLQFWQLYFLTTPHRWLTLWLVACDPDRRGGRSGRFVAIALAAAVVVAGVWLATGAFLCLALVDYLWNNWHFAAQHGGVLRMYSRKAGGGRPRLETWGLRLLVVYVTTRMLGWSYGWTETVPQAANWLPWVDLLSLLGPALLLQFELREPSAARLPKLIYLVSVTGLYGGLLASVNWGWQALAGTLAIAASMFHAVEYLAIVTHYARRRQQQGSAGAFQSLARHWGLALGAFLVGWGAFAYLSEQELLVLWSGVNLWASALHYAYDGLIWKLRLPATAQALGVELPRKSLTAEAPA